ncbi:MAG: hypothetical protein EPN60_15970 [Nevskiaceae bacterium]|nr:MAG: hypothetical protein EPO48_07600 [Nevskiaceae bacterium]TAM22927.1 MAG: hypothetical protein EPN60_15970 [Nevskiaceae bacterium]
MRVTRFARCAGYALAVALLSACGGGNGNQDQLSGGSGETPQTFDSMVLFDPIPIKSTDSATVPFPFDGFFSGFKDPTLNIPNSSNAPFVTAANLQDGFSTTASLFLDILGFVDFASVSQNLLIVNSSTGQVLQAGVDFTIQPSPAKDGTGLPISSQRSRVLIEPLKPLTPSTRYLVALKNGVKTTEGKGVFASPQFRVARSGTPVSQQTEPILASYSDAQKAGLEQLRSQLIRPVVAAFGQLASIPEDQIVLAWSFTTQSTEKTLKALAAVATAGTITVQNTGQNTSVIGAPAIADIYAGVVAVPYYLANSGGSPQSTAPLTGFWTADPTKPDLAASFLGQVPCGAFASGATLPDGQTATPSVSTTVCYPLPVKKSDETLPLLVAVPNANSGQSKPESGWPVVIFQHGITGNRTQMLAIAPALAAAGFVTVAIDLPLHGLASSSPFYRNQLFTGTPAAGLMTGERTFDLDLVSNTTGAAGPDGVTDSSGTHFINLSSLITSRDNLRQASSDLLTLTKSLANLDLDNDGAPDIDGSQLRFVGHSLGGIVGGSFLGADTSVGAATLAMPGGGIAKLLDASKSFGPIVSAGLAASGVAEGTDTYETFLRFAQTLVDSADPLNFAASAKANHPLHLIEVQGDTVVPNAANAGAASASNDLVTITGYLSGTDPLIATLGLDVVGPLTPPLTSVVLKTGAKLAVATVFTTGNHGSILDPSGSDINAATTQEMQRQTANFLKSNGTCLPTGGNCSAE